MIPAKVLEIHENDGISVVKFLHDELLFSMLSLENLGLKVGQSVRLGFKSSDVIISKAPLFACSVNNAIKAKIAHANIGEIIACLHLNADDFEFESIISKESFSRLNLSVGDEVYAYVKSTSLFISSFDDRY
ncbi:MULTISPECIES: TOBE domain-containing protein [unclassified Campylobacter]|uniref:TOBE domain-containing protein n=1 Tax=unclassified Campylobacter TaxID=2593542 RepID=UPI003D330E90